MAPLQLTTKYSMAWIHLAHSTTSNHSGSQMNSHQFAHYYYYYSNKNSFTANFPTCQNHMHFAYPWENTRALITLYVSSRYPDLFTFNDYSIQMAGHHSFKLFTCPWRTRCSNWSIPQTDRPWCHHLYLVASSLKYSSPTKYALMYMYCLIYINYQIIILICRKILSIIP